MSLNGEAIQSGFWKKGANTIIQGQNPNGTLNQECLVFDVRVDTSLKIRIECKDNTKIENISLSNQGTYTISKSRNQITVTKFNYLPRKLRTSNLEVSSIRVPYVEEIIQIKKQGNGGIAFYMENFKVDEFGRIVQKSFIQAHGLTNKNLNISSN